MSNLPIQVAIICFGENAYELVFAAGDVRDIHVVGGWAQVFQLLASEDIDSNEMHLGVTVLAGLRGGHLDNLAGTALDNDEAVLSQGRTLHRVGGGGTSIGALEGVLMLQRAIRLAEASGESRRKPVICL